MGRYEISVDVPLAPDEVFRLWTDAGRWPQWQVGLLRIAEASGPATQVGTAFILDFGPGMKRNTRVVEVDPPRTYAVEEDGMRSRNRTAVAFEPIGSGTRIVLTYDLQVQLGAVSGVMERLTRGSTTKTGRQELERFARFAGRPLFAPTAGSFYTVDGFAGFRVVKVIALDHDVVHLALIPGVAKERPGDIAEILDNESRLDDPLALRPLDPPLRRTASSSIVGQPLLALDGGVGVPHLAMTIGAFADGLPEPAGDGRIYPDESEELDAWRNVSGPVLGRDLETSIVPLVSIKDGDRYAIAKLLRVEKRGVHIRLYANRFDIPPDELNPWTLRLDRHDAPDLSIGHLPLSRSAFAEMEPAYERLAMRSSDELEGYRIWKDGSGEFFASLPD
jgi:uncharacterized protein YndB with AHSA1/START domain